MKKFNLLLLLMGLTTAVMFTGCKNDDDEDPITPTPSIENATADTTVQPTEQYDIEFTAKASSDNTDLERVKVSYRINNGAEVTALDTMLPNNTKEFNYDENFTAPATEGNVLYTLTVTDEKDEIASKSINVSVVSNVETYSAVIMGGQANSTGSFYETETNTVHTQASAKSNAADVDFVYYYGASNFATIAAPDDSDAGTVYNNASTGLQTWSTRNSTRFRAVTTMTSAQYDAIVTDDQLVAEAAGANLTAATNLAIGEIYAFKTDDGRSGLFRVDGIVPTDSGSITISVKVQDEQ